MNTKEELLEKLIIMKDVYYVSKEGDGISVRLSTLFNSNNAQRFIDVLKGYQWSIESQGSTYIKIIVIQ